MRLQGSGLAVVDKYDRHLKVKRLKECRDIQGSQFSIWSVYQSHPEALLMVGALPVEFLI